ncbi:hypothetical protein [Sphingomonas bacterium]|uniref:hypothetical protein n=1 Tax=Sphingomonas bacterium TaxID=1895847 RepID=UPI0015751837|nr:hypothetical protein [Sphingomonas bacterium]
MARNGRLAAVLLTGMAAFGLYQYRQARQAEKAQAQAELQAGIDASRVLSAAFGREASLRVATLTGQVRSRGACLTGGLLTNTQATVAPYRVAYSVDLGHVDRRNYRWDARGRVMFVELPGVVAEPPAIDMARARTAQSGLFISRACGVAMQGQVAGRLAAAAADRSLAPAYLAQARESARDAVGRITRAPLAAGGLGTVSVRIRFATDPRPQDDRRWDVSRSIEDVLADPRLHP